MTRKIIVEVNLSLDYLGVVLREIRWRSQEESCTDPFIKRIYERRLQTSPYRHTKRIGGRKGPWSFKFSIDSRHHHRGAVYVFNYGVLRKIIRNTCGKKDGYGDLIDDEVLAEVDMPDLDDMNPEKLLDLINEIEIIQIMSS